MTERTFIFFSFHLMLWDSSSEKGKNGKNIIFQHSGILHKTDTDLDALLHTF